MLEGLEDLAQLGSWEGAGDDEALQADDGDAGKLCIFGATSDDEGVDKVRVLGEFLEGVSRVSRQKLPRICPEHRAEGGALPEPIWTSVGVLRFLSSSRDFSAA